MNNLKCDSYFAIIDCPGVSFSSFQARAWIILGGKQPPPPRKKNKTKQKQKQNKTKQTTRQKNKSKTKTNKNTKHWFDMWRFLQFIVTFVTSVDFCFLALFCFQLLSFMSPVDKSKLQSTI